MGSASVKRVPRKKLDVATKQRAFFGEEMNRKLNNGLIQSIHQNAFLSKLPSRLDILAE